MRGKKTDPQVKETARHMAASGKTASEISRELGIACGTVCTWMAQWKNDDEFNKLQCDKKRGFAEKAAEICDLGQEILLKRLRRTLDRENEITKMLDDATRYGEITQRDRSIVLARMKALFVEDAHSVSTIVGTMYDKMRLAQGQSTEIVVAKFEDI